MPDLQQDLMGHWPLTSDLHDHGAQKLATSATDVRIVPAPPGRAGNAGQFNGRSSVLEVADHPSLHLGKGDFALAAWVHTQGAPTDVVGDLLGKFDPITRKGFNFSILSNNGVTSTAQANYRHLQFGIDDGRIESAWREHGRPGNAVKIAALAVSNGCLYAGTVENAPDQVGRLWRFDGGQRWIDLGNPMGCNGVTSIAEYQGQLYSGTGRYKVMGSCMGETLNRKPGGRVFRVTEEGQWIDCGHPGGKDAVPEPMAEGYGTGQADMICGLITLGGRLYCAQSYRKGVFRYEGGTEWTQVGLNDLRMMCLAVYRGQLYSLINGGPVYRYDGGDRWTDCGTPAGSTQTYCAVIYQGRFHVGTWPNGDVFRYEGGTDWVKIGRVGYEMEVMAGVNYNGKAYWGSLPMANVYRMEKDWLELVGNLDQSVVPIRRVWSMATYDGRLYAGTLPGGRVCSIEAGKVATWDQTFPPGWHHVAAVKDGSALKSYVDGKLVAWSTRFHPGSFDLSNGEPLRIGFGAYEHLEGMLSDVRVYRRALEASQVAQLAQA